MPDTADDSPHPSPWSQLNPCSPKALHEALEELAAAPRKRWGQNFLIDLAAQRRIVAAAKLEAQQRVWEIGPGFGALTQHLWGKCQELILFEIDPVMNQFYQKYLHDSFRLLQGDIIKTWRQELAQNPPPDLVIGNLPYNSASLILKEFALANFRPPTMVFTVQKELAERLTAIPRSKAYSSFSVCIQLQFVVEILFDLPAQVFTPKPNVCSTAIRLKPRAHNLSHAQISLAEKLSHNLFRQRRKTIGNNLKNISLPYSAETIEAALNQCGIQRGQRAEEIALEQFCDIARNLLADSPTP